MIKPINKNDPFYLAFKDQRHNAARRGIEWKFDFWTWKAFWEASGKWEQRGKGRGYYCMSRIGDSGPYAPHNVYINLYEANMRDAAHKRHASTH